MLFHSDETFWLDAGWSYSDSADCPFEPVSLVLSDSYRCPSAGECFEGNSAVQFGPSIDEHLHPAITNDNGDVVPQTQRMKSFFVDERQRRIPRPDVGIEVPLVPGGKPGFQHHAVPAHFPHMQKPLLGEAPRVGTEEHLQGKCIETGKRIMLQKKSIAHSVKEDCKPMGSFNRRGIPGPVDGHLGGVVHRCEIPFNNARLLPLLEDHRNRESDTNKRAKISEHSITPSLNSDICPLEVLVSCFHHRGAGARFDFDSCLTVCHFNDGTPRWSSVILENLSGSFRSKIDSFVVVETPAAVLVDRPGDYHEISIPKSFAR